MVSPGSLHSVVDLSPPHGEEISQLFWIGYVIQTELFVPMDATQYTEDTNAMSVNEYKSMLMTKVAGVANTSVPQMYCRPMCSF